MIGTTNWAYAGAVIDTSSDPIRIATPAMQVKVARSPCRVSVSDAAGNPLVWEQATEGVFYDGVRLGHAAGADFYGIHGYNVWDDSSAGLLRRAGGWAEAGFQGDCGAPFIWNRKGFGLLIDSDGIQFNATSNALVAEYCSRTEIEFYVLVGRPREILSAAAAVSGRPPMFPKWGLGFANTEWGITQSELTNIVNGYRSRGIPIDLYILDFDWKTWGADHYGEWNWNSTKFPGGASGALKSQMDARGIRLGGIMKPRVHVNTEQGNYAAANGFWWPGQSQYSDYFSGQPVKDLNFSNANCRQWFFNHSTNAFDTGMVAWWNDEADQAGGGGAVFGNWQFMNMQRALYDGQRGMSDRRVWSLNRNFWLGGQRYAYAMWSGDIDGGFTAMRNQRERMLSAINLGEARWGMDIGGFNNGGNTTAECYARWMQFGSMVPVFRVHGQQNQQRQPWVYGTQAEAVATAAIRLRYRLMPYLYSYDRLLHETGVGMVRPLVLDFPDDENAVNYKDAWMFGDFLLAAPVLDQGQSLKNVYLPAGKWRDFFKGTAYAGGKAISYSVNSSTWEDLPLFAREGAILPLQPVMNYVRESPVTNVDIVMLPSTNQTSFVFYEDDGETYGYETGAFFRQSISLIDNGDAIQADFFAPSGTYAPEVEFYYAYIQCPTNSGASVDAAALPLATSEGALRASPAAGWAHATNQFGYAALVKIPAGVEQHVALNNNLTAVPVFSPAAGTYGKPVQLSLSCATPSADIHYTMDGTDPDEASPLYDDPFDVAVSVEIRARAYAARRVPSAIASATYTIDTNGIVPVCSLVLPVPGAVVSGKIVVSGTASDNVSVVKSEFQLDENDWVAATGTTNWSYLLDTARFLNGTHRLSARATDSSNNLSEAASVTVRFFNIPDDYVQRISAGNPNAVTNCDGTVWMADRAYLLGEYGYSMGTNGYLGNLITGICTAAQSLYQRERYSTPSTSFRYLFDCPPGIYAITLLEAETWTNAPNKRLFNVYVEGQQVLTSCDIFAAAGGKNLPLSLAFTGTVADTQLEILFIPQIDNARASGIQVQKIGDVDSDADGIPDWWSWAFFDHAAGLESDGSRAGDDPDLDGKDNRSEFEALTDPTDAESVFLIDYVAGEENPTLYYQSASGRLYTVQGAFDLLDTDCWINIQSELPGTNGPTSFIDTNQLNFHFYRLGVARP